jgi:hypothetical protein
MSICVHPQWHVKDGDLFPWMMLISLIEEASQFNLTVIGRAAFNKQPALKRTTTQI